MKKIYQYFLFQLIVWLIFFSLLSLAAYIILRHTQMQRDVVYEGFNYWYSVPWASLGAVNIVLWLTIADFYFERFSG